MVHISAKQIEKTTEFKELVEELRRGFQSTIETPMRHHHDFPNPEASQDSTLLLMPSWEAGKNLGVKVVTVSPDNGMHNLPSIQGIYLLFDAVKGNIKALIEGKTMTVKRTAAASALASSYLSRPDSNSLLMIGTGALSKNLIEAHCSQRPISKVWIWGRTLAKAEAIKEQLNHLDPEIACISDLDAFIPKVSIISVATLSPIPLIKGELLVEGQHIDLVGSYKKDSREADDLVILRSTVFVDTFQGALKESGDLVLPLKNGIIKESDIKADLYGLCGEKHQGRSSEKEITVFKSVGHASEDLIAANYFYSKFVD